MEFIDKYPNKPWSWRRISGNPNITMEIIEKYPNKPWDWGDWGISCNPNITMEMVEKYPNKTWKWEKISKSPNITMEFIEKHKDKIKFAELHYNPFTYENKRVKKNEAYWVLEKLQAFNKTENLVVIDKYM
jgi:hypothetical protein